MGALRLFLALSVIAGHSQSTVFGFNGIGAWYAVNFFFIISGFYMTMILNEKYKEKNPIIFYINRILRLFPTYYIGLIISLVVSFSIIVNFFNNLSLGGKVFYILQNTFILGQDVAYIANICTNTGIAYPVSMTINPPAWSLSVELMFYLIAPFFLKDIRKTFILFCIGVLYLLFIKHGLNYPIASSEYFKTLMITDLNYYFYPSSLIFFTGGSLSYHLYKKGYKQNHIYPLVIISLIFLSFSETIMPFWHLFLISFIIPILFELTKENNFDRLLGELSYPAYILHFPVLLLFQKLNFVHLNYFNYMTLGSYVAITSCLIGLFMHYIVENKINFYRQSYILNSQIKFNNNSCSILQIIVAMYISFASIVLFKLYYESRNPNVLMAFNLSDTNWKYGISIQSSNGFFIQNTNKNNIKIGDVLKFNTGTRTVIDIIKSKEFINIYVDGDRLDPLKDGYPYAIRVIKSNEKI